MMNKLTKHNICLNLSALNPEELINLGRFLDNNNENVYPYTLYLLLKGKYWKKDKYLVYTHRNEWLPSSLVRTKHEITIQELKKLIIDE